MKKNTCEDRLEDNLKSRVADLKRLLAGDENEDTGTLAEYALGFDFVVADTFADQPEGYFRYQISWGGPSDEFRFFTDATSTCHRIEYWFLDWFDGAHRVLENDDKAVIRELWAWLLEGGAVAHALREATKP